MTRRVWLLRALLLAPLLPLAAGRRMVTYQDAIMTHLPAKAATVEQVRAGSFPFLSPYASFGQPLAGNPNFGTFFPDMLAFLVLPLPAAFGLRFALAALLAYAGARRWARAEGASRGASEVAAAAFALSGVYVSTWRFFNSSLALALAPWVMAAAARVAGSWPAATIGAERVRRAVAELALVAALEILAGEPVIALMSLGLGLARAVAGARGERGRALAGSAAALALGVTLAAPQIAATWQVYPTSTRSLAPFPYLLASSTSLTPARVLEQVTPFPFGRPDLTGEAGFIGHEHYDNHAPYLWTLHAGWVVLVLLLLGARPLEPRERWWWLLLALAVLLSFGRGLPGAKWLHPIVSVGGRMRFPVKWWYVAALALVPLVARAVERMDSGVAPSRGGRWRAAVAIAVGTVLLLVVRPAGIAAVAAAVSCAAAILVFVRRPRAETLSWLVAATLGLSAFPLWRTLVDARPEAPPHFAGGRVYERAAAEAHPAPHSADWPPVEATTREIFRRAPRDLWALTGALARMPYAFDGDPDGIYFEGDRVVGKSIDSLPWPDRAPALRAAGVGYVVARSELPAPFAPLAVLDPARGVVLHRLEAFAPPVRVATRLLPAASFADVVPLLSRPDFDPRTDAVVMGSGTIRGASQPSRLDVLEEGATRMRAHVDVPAPALVVWSRTFFRAWRATVDGRATDVVVADGHLVGVPIGPGAHEIDVRWSATPVLLGAVLSLLAITVLAWLGRRGQGGVAGGTGATAPGGT